MKSRASNICWWKATNQNSQGNFQELDRIAALVSGKPELAVFYFVLFLPYISFEYLTVILLSNPARAPLRCPGFLAFFWNKSYVVVGGECFLCCCLYWTVYNFIVSEHIKLACFLSLCLYRASVELKVQSAACPWQNSSYNSNIEENR